MADWLLQFPSVPAARVHALPACTTQTPPTQKDAGMSPTRLTRRIASLLAAVCSLAMAQAAAAQGTIIGRLTTQGSNEPVAEGRVIVVGTSLFASTNADGRYTIRNVPSGLQQVRVMRVGYAEQKKSVEITTGQTSTLDFQLATV